MSITVAFIIGVAVLLFLALKLKVSAFLSLLATALTIGILSGMGTTETIKDIVAGFSKSVGSIGLVIIFKKQLTSLVNTIFETITSKSNDVLG